MRHVADIGDGIDIDTEISFTLHLHRQSPCHRRFALDPSPPAASTLDLPTLPRASCLNSSASPAPSPSTPPSLYYSSPESFVLGSSIPSIAPLAYPPAGLPEYPLAAHPAPAVATHPRWLIARRARLHGNLHSTFDPPRLVILSSTISGLLVPFLVSIEVLIPNSQVLWRQGRR